MTFWFLQTWITEDEARRGMIVQILRTAPREDPRIPARLLYSEIHMELILHGFYLAKPAGERDLLDLLNHRWILSDNRHGFWVYFAQEIQGRFTCRTCEKFRIDGVQLECYERDGSSMRRIKSRYIPRWCPLREYKIPLCRKAHEVDLEWLTP